MLKTGQEKQADEIAPFSKIHLLAKQSGARGEFVSRLRTKD